MALANLNQICEAVQISAQALVSEARLRNLTGAVRPTGGALLVFIGPPDRVVEWTIAMGSGTLTPYTSFTDGHGQALARFDASGSPGLVRVRVTFVP
jgi:hypothetical protein